MEVSIRAATQQDAESIKGILDYAVSSKMYRGDLAWGDKAYDDQGLAEAIARGSVYVVETAGEGVVATFRLELQDESMWGPQPSNAVYVQRFATANGFRGQGLGKQLFEYITQMARSGGKQFVRLICPQENTKLAAYHESNGFVRVDYKAKPYVPSPVVYFERPVDPNYQEPPTAKHGFLNRLRRNH